MEQPCGPHALIPKLPENVFFLQLIGPVILYISQEEGGGRTTKLGGVKIASRLRDVLFSLSIQKGGVRGAEAGNHPRGRGWGGGGTLRNKVQVTS